MSLPYMSYKEQWEWIKPVWRVLIIILISQLTGILYGFQEGFGSKLVFGFWYGAAYASPFGCFFGLLWHWYAVPHGISSNRSILIALGGMSVALALAARFTEGITH